MNLPDAKWNTSFFAQTLDKAPPGQLHLLCPNISYPHRHQSSRRLLSFLGHFLQTKEDAYLLGNLIFQISCNADS